MRKINRARDTCGYFNLVYKEMKAHDPEHFSIYTRMKSEVYNLLFYLLRERLEKNRSLNRLKLMSFSSNVQVIEMYLNFECYNKFFKFNL